MIGEKILSEKPVTLYFVKKYLQHRKKEKELRYEQDQAYKYALAFCKIGKRERKKLMAEFKQLPTFNRELAVQVANILPKSMEVMKILPAKERKVSPEDLQKALEITQRVAKK